MMHGGGLMLVAVSMLSLVAGMFLLMKACREEVCCKSFHKVVAYAVIVISMLLILCGGYRSITGYSRHPLRPRPMMGRMMGGKGMNPEMMMEMMKDCPMMRMMGQMRETKEGE